MDRRKFIHSTGALALSSGVSVQPGFSQVPTIKSPLIVKDDINALPQISAFPTPNLIHDCNIIRDLRNAYAKSHVALLGDTNALDELHSATRAAFEKEFQVKNAQINSFKKKFPKAALLEQKRLITMQTWGLVKGLGKYIVVDIAPLVAKSLSPTGMFFTGVSAISAANDVRMQIIDASNGADNAGSLLYSFVGARNSGFNILALETGHKQLEKLAKGSSILVAIINGGLLAYKTMRVVGNYQDLEFLNNYYETLISDYTKMTKLLEEIFKDRDAFLELLISQQSATAKALEHIYIATSFSSCQTLPVIGLSKFLENQFPQYSVLQFSKG